MTAGSAGGSTTNGSSAGGSAAEGSSAVQLFDALAARQLELPGVTYGRHFAREALKIHDKMYAWVHDDRLVLKLPAARVTALIESGLGLPFGTGGRVMREWVTVQEDGADWPALIDEAREFVDPTT